jgi:hypothetical protein
MWSASTSRRSLAICSSSERGRLAEGGFLALDFSGALGHARCAGPPRGLRRGVIGFEQARLTILAQHEEGADIGLVLVRDQQIGVGEPVMLGIERVIFRLQRLDIIASSGASRISAISVIRSEISSIRACASALGSARRGQ